MKFVNNGFRVESPAGLKVAIALDNAWANKIATTLNAQLELVGILKEISEMVAELNEHLLVRSKADDKTKVIIDEIRDRAKKAAHLLQSAPLD